MNPTGKRGNFTFDDLKIWQRHIVGAKFATIGGDIGPNPVEVGPLLIASVHSPALIAAMDRETGDMRWRRDLAGLCRSSVAAANGSLIVNTEGALLSLSQDVGEIIWMRETDVAGEAWLYAPSVVGGDQLFLGDNAGRLSCIDTRTGELLWAQKLAGGANQAVNARPLLFSNLVLVGDVTGTVVAYRVDSGAEEWRKDLGEAPVAQALLFGQLLVIRSLSGIYWLRTEDGAIESWRAWSDSQPWTIVCSEDALFGVTMARNPEPPPFGTVAHMLTSFRGGEAEYSVPIAGFVNALQWQKETGLLYASTLQGLAIIDPTTGNTLHRVSAEDRVDRSSCDPITLAHENIYVLTMHGDVWALRHP